MGYLMVKVCHNEGVLCVRATKLRVAWSVYCGLCKSRSHMRATKCSDVEIVAVVRYALLRSCDEGTSIWRYCTKPWLVKMRRATCSKSIASSIVTILAYTSHSKAPCEKYLRTTGSGRLGRSAHISKEYFTHEQISWK